MHEAEDYIMKLDIRFWAKTFEKANLYGPFFGPLGFICCGSIDGPTYINGFVLEKFLI